MTNQNFVNVPGKTFQLGLLLLAIAVSHSTACPESCYCIDNFVTCSDFTFLDLLLLPAATDTLILTRGNLEEIPSGFLVKTKNLKMLEMNFVNAKVVRSGAFSGLSNLDLFSITSSTFDVLESESFSNFSEVSKFHISESKFNRLDKHAFANIKDVLDFQIWSNTIDVISDETFYKLSDIISFRLYQNNITSLGNKLFLGSSSIDDITVYKNKIQRVSEQSFQNVKDITSRMVLYANVFDCSCDIVWILDKTVFKEYLSSNDCVFPDHTGQEIITFRMADVTREALCPGISSAQSTDSIPSSTVRTTETFVADTFVTTDTFVTADTFDTSDTFVTTNNLISTDDSTDKEPTSTFSHRFSLTSTSTLVTSIAALESSTLKRDSSTASSIDTSSFSQSILKSSTAELSKHSSPTPDFFIRSTTDTQFPDDTDYTVYFTNTPQMPEQTKGYLTNNKNTPDFLREVTPEGRTAPVPQASIDVDKNEHVRPLSTSATDLTTSLPDTASNISHGNRLFIAVLSGLSLLLIYLI